MTDENLDLLRDLSHEVRDLSTGWSVETIDFPIDPLIFYRDYVSASKPVIIKGALDGAPFLETWTNEHLLQVLGDVKVSVAVTPDGFADAVAHMHCPDGRKLKCFALPLEERMAFKDFLQYLRRIQNIRETNAVSLGHTESTAPPSPTGVLAEATDPDQPDLQTSYKLSAGDDTDLEQNTVTEDILYIQQQNNNLFSPELCVLAKDVPDLPWASQVFGNKPEAVNFWMGADESVTSFHRDHYENLYAVAAGQKVFTLLPPCDAYRLSMQDYPVAKYERQHGRLELVLQEGTEPVRWSSINPTLPLGRELEAMKQHPLFFDPGLPAPLQATVSKGDLLYLPSMWFHHVRQIADDQGRVIAINWWHDMRWDIRAAYTRMVDRMYQ